MNTHETLYFEALFDEPTFHQAMRTFATATSDATLIKMLDFVESIQRYQRLRSQDNMMHAAQTIVQEFELNNEQTIPVFLSAEKIKTLLSTISQVEEKKQGDNGLALFLQTTLFDDLFDETFEMLQYDVFPRFVTSSEFNNWCSGMIRQLDNSQEEFDKNFNLRSRYNQERIKASYFTNVREVKKFDDSADHPELPPVPSTVELIANQINDEQQILLNTGLHMSIVDLEKLVVRMACPHHMGGVQRETTTRQQQRQGWLKKIFKRKKTDLTRMRQNGNGSPFFGSAALQFIKEDSSLPNAARSDDGSLALVNLLCELNVMENKVKRRVRRRASRQSSVNAISLFNENALYHFTHRKKLVIVGCGFGGLQLARQLASDFDTTIIDLRSHYEFNISFHDMFNKPDLFDKLRFDYTKILGNVRVVQGTAMHVSTEAVFVKPAIRNDNGTTSTSGDELMAVPFDYVVLCTGSSYYSPFPIRTTAEGSPPTIIYPYKSNFILDNLDKVKKAKRIAVIGGGPLAIEVTGEICHLVQDNPEATQVIQLTHCNFLLERLNVQVHKSAHRLLTQFPNLEILYNRRVVAIENDCVLFNFNRRVGGDASSETELHTQSMQFDVIVVCVGMYPNTTMLDRFLSSSLTTRGYVQIDPSSFRVARNVADAQDRDPNIFELKSIDEEAEVADIESIEESQDANEPFHQIAKLFDSAIATSNDDDEILNGEKSTGDYFEHIFAIGDIATGTNEEKMAIVAGNHAKALINILRHKERDLPQRKCAYTPISKTTQVITVGPTKAMIVRGEKVIFQGPLARKFKNWQVSTTLNFIRNP